MKKKKNIWLGAVTRCSHDDGTWRILPKDPEMPEKTQQTAVGLTAAATADLRQRRLLENG